MRLSLFQLLFLIILFFILFDKKLEIKKKFLYFFKDIKKKFYIKNKNK